MKLSKLFSLITATWLGLSSACSAASYGTFNGLFYEPDGVWEQTAGTMSVSVTDRGRFTGRIQMGPYRYSIGGYFEGDTATTAILRRGLRPLEIQLQYSDEDPDIIFGTLSDGEWTADLVLDKAVFDGKRRISPDAGQYTMIIPGNFTSETEPGGDSYGTVTVDRAGRIRFACSLADGAKFTQSSFISKGGQWPLFASLYRGTGAIYGWMLFNNSPDEPLTGDVTWIRPEMPWTYYYPDGFAITASAWGSRYQRGGKILDISNGLVEFNGGNLPEGITNRVILDDRNRVQNLSPNFLLMSFNTSNGLFTGRVLHPISFEWIRFSGVVLQDFATAGGFFLDWDQSGEVWMAQRED